MPFYSYNCETCKKTFKSFHSPDEIEEKCVICKSSTIKKVLPTVRKVDSSSKNESAGSRVEKFIEESRQTLQQQMEEARKEYK